MENSSKNGTLRGAARPPFPKGKNVPHVIGRQEQILALRAQGQTIVQIAQHIGITKQCVWYHIQRGSRAPRWSDSMSARLKHCLAEVTNTPQLFEIYDEAEAAKIVAKVSEEHVLHWPSFGVVCFEEMQRWLNRHGLTQRKRLTEAEAIWWQQMQPTVNRRRSHFSAENPALAERPAD